MGRTMYKTCELVMKEALRRGFELQITWPELENILRQYAGSNRATLKSYRRELQINGFIKSINNFTFEIQEKAKELIK